MKLLTTTHRTRLLKEGEKAAADPRHDLFPVVKLFSPDAGATWLLAWIQPESPDIAFGLCDLGIGCPELGMVRLSEVAEMRGSLGQCVQRDRFWKATQRLSNYTIAAERAGRIVNL